jgi:fructuronate reductase
MPSTMTQPDPGSNGLPRLSRSLLGLHTSAPIRLLHIGLGNFHCAHQAWYTANAPDASAWGIAAFTGRRPDTADDLAPQDGLYTLITRSADGDAFEVIGSPRFIPRRITRPISTISVGQKWQ